MGIEANKDLVRRFEAALNAADWEALDAILTEDFRRHCQATPDVEVNSREEFKQLQRGFLTSFPDQRVTTEMMIAEGDKVAMYGTYTGTNTGPLGETPATGKAGAVKMMGMLGLFPPPAATSS